MQPGRSLAEEYGRFHAGIAVAQETADRIWHGGPILTPDDAAYINEHTDTVGFVGASSLERMAVEQPLTELTQQFKSIPVKRIK